MKIDSPPNIRKISRAARTVMMIAALLVLLAAAMLVLMKTGFRLSSRTTDEYSAIEQRLNDPANAQYAETARADVAEIRKLKKVRSEITGKIGSFGTNAPEDKFFQNEIQRLDQTVEKRKTHLEEIKRELK